MLELNYCAFANRNLLSFHSHALNVCHRLILLAILTDNCLFSTHHSVHVSHAIQVDILDTSGDMQFPAMRRLSIATAHAFLLVYATTSAPSFASVKQCFDEIREQRADFQVRTTRYKPIRVRNASCCLLSADRYALVVFIFQSHDETIAGMRRYRMDGPQGNSFT